jgi:pyruvate dehydrogenase E1 component
MIVTSPDRLEADWRGSMADGRASQIERLLRDVSHEAGLITVADAHPATLSWIGAVGRHPLIPLGVDRFGQSGDIPDLYHAYGIDADAILTAAARLIAPRI